MPLAIWTTSLIASVGAPEKNGSVEGPNGRVTSAVMALSAAAVAEGTALASASSSVVRWYRVSAPNCGDPWTPAASMSAIRVCALIAPELTSPSRSFCSVVSVPSADWSAATSWLTSDVNWGSVDH